MSLTTSFIAEIVVVNPDLPLASTIRTTSDISLQVESQPLTHPESASIFYSVSNSDFQDFETALTDDHTVEDWQVTMSFKDCRIYRLQHSSVTEFLTPKLAGLGIQALSIESCEEGWSLQLQAPDKESLGEFWQYCREENVQFRLEKVYSSGSQITAVAGERLKAQLTGRQQEVARTVTQMGYYDQDGASAEEIAAELGIAPSTLSTHLRRIVEKLFWYMFENE